MKSFSSYPDEVQCIIKENPMLKSKIKSTAALTSFVVNILIFSVVLFIFGLFTRQESFVANFLNTLILGQFLNAFDFFIIDMLWWRNSKRIRFTGTENNQSIYRNPKKHFISFLKGIFVFLIVAMIDGLLLSCF
ncbi:hypothetical protein [Anaerocolumna sp.]|uniref:hypothetical protein n=1 Tax=Anaerocolumna sp. TaxID=2041569 RepID=UPI0028A78278|nr:hypothetical protein [Anaerocolumna sp.]